MKERKELSYELLSLESHRARHQWLHLLAPIWIRVAANTDKFGKADYATKALENHLGEASASCFCTFLYSGNSAMLAMMQYDIVRDNRDDRDEYLQWLRCWVKSGGELAVLIGAVNNFFQPYFVSLTEGI